MRLSYEECQQRFFQANANQNWNDVAAWATECLRYDPTKSLYWTKRGIALHKLGSPFDGILNYNRAIELGPTPENLTNKGSALLDLEEYEEARKWFDLSLDMDPTTAPTLMNIGHSYKSQGKIEAAIRAYKSCTEADPTYADGHMAYGMALLRNGQLEEGWPEYEWRWKTDQLPQRKIFGVPQWRGEDLTDKSILVYGEQGLGDMIQFARYAPILAKSFPRCRVIIECRHPVARLLATMPEIYMVLKHGEKLPRLDYMVSMLTLAGMLTPNIEAIPSQTREYFIRKSDLDVWKSRISALPTGLKVGVCFSGMSRTENLGAFRVDQLRSTDLSTFAPLATIPGIIWVSLQKGPQAQQVRRPPSGMTIAEFDEDIYDFYETCALIENLDLVISVDTAVAHAAASVGKPTWVLSRWDGCWRWFGDREDSPWYPTVRQFVQPKLHDWPGLMQKVKTELGKWASEQKPRLDTSQSI